MGTLIKKMMCKGLKHVKYVKSESLWIKKHSNKTNQNPYASKKKKF